MLLISRGSTFSGVSETRAAYTSPSKSAPRHTLPDGHRSTSPQHPLPDDGRGSMSTYIRRGEPKDHSDPLRRCAALRHHDL